MIKTDADVRAFMKLAHGPVQGQISIIHHGIRRSLFTKMAMHIGLPQKRLAETLKLNVRTLRNRSAGQRLNQVESEKSLRVARIFSQAVKVLGSNERARNWIVSPIESLGNARPIDLLETDVGAQEVSNVLSAIHWGVCL